MMKQVYVLSLTSLIDYISSNSVYLFLLHHSLTQRAPLISVVSNIEQCEVGNTFWRKGEGGGGWREKVNAIDS